MNATIDTVINIIKGHLQDVESEHLFNYDLGQIDAYKGLIKELEDLKKSN